MPAYLVFEEYKDSSGNNKQKIAIYSSRPDLLSIDPNGIKHKYILLKSAHNESFDDACMSLKQNLDYDDLRMLERYPSD
jgi:hypothetical protein